MAMVMFQGLAWNINSFDQEGVQLGRLLTKEVLGGARTTAFSRTRTCRVCHKRTPGLEALIGTPVAERPGRL